MNHASTTPDSDGGTETPQSSTVANPRRTRLGADGHPIAVSASSAAE
jgi:hypothetical protein